MEHDVMRVLACGLQGLARGTAQGGDSGGCGEAPQLVHGEEDHRGLRHPHEQSECAGWVHPSLMNKVSAGERCPHEQSECVRGVHSSLGHGHPAQGHLQTLHFGRESQVASSLAPYLVTCDCCRGSRRGRGTWKRWPCGHVTSPSASCDLWLVTCGVRQVAYVLWLVMCDLCLAGCWAGSGGD